MKKKFTEEQIIGILREAEAMGQNTDICRKHGISEQTFYRWKKKFYGMDVADARRLRLLEGENSRLKRLVAEQALAIHTMQEVLRKKGSASPRGDR